MARQSDTSRTSPGLDPLGIRAPGRPMPRSVLPFFVVGLHLGVLQTALFFVLQVQVTATFMGYFAVVMAWMGGIILNLRWARPRSMEGALIVSAGAYLLALGLGRVPGPLGLQLALHVALATVVALPAGAFFREYSSSTSSRSLFLHENNGFILGLLLGMVGARVATSKHSRGGGLIATACG